MPDREEEIAQYVEAYKHDNYRMGDPRKNSITQILKNLDGTLLDVGTGRGETLDLCENRGIVATGTEVVDYLVAARSNVVLARSIDLPFPDNYFDHVTCFDVMEHLIEEDLIPSIREMVRVSSKTVTISASETPHVYQGRDLHISSRSKARWLELIRRATDYDVVGLPPCGGSPCFQIQTIKR